jgi:predicted CopG family antitoxin
MGAKYVRLDEDVYEAIRARKRDEETFSEAVERLVSTPSLLGIAGIFSDEEADGFREAVNEADAVDDEDLDDLVDRFEGA